MVDFLGKIAGPALKDNLLRLGVDLSIETNLLYVDVNNKRIGINTATPNVDLDVNGLANFSNTLQINAGNITTLSNNANIYLTPNGSGQVIIAGTLSPGNLSITNGGNISGANVIFSNTYTSNVTTGTAPLTVNSTTRVANLNVAVAGNLINGNSSVTVNPNGNVNISVAGNSNVVVITGTGANITGTANVSGTIYGADANLSGNLSVNGNVTMGNLNLANIVSNGNLTANTLVVNNSANLGNLSITNLTINSVPLNSNIYLAPNGTGGVVVNAVSALTLPSGLGSDRPVSPVAGMIRWNRSNSKFEWFDGSAWNSVTSAQTQLTSDTFYGDGNQYIFTLSQPSTTAATLVSINGVIQAPTSAYTISGSTLTFTEVPSDTDVIEARTMVTVSATTDLSDGTTSVVTNNAASKISLTIRGSAKAEVNATDIVLYNSNIVSNVTAQTVNSSAVTIDQWPTANYTSAKYLVSITNGTGRQMTELLLTANSTNAYLANIGSVNSGSSLMTFTANIVSGNATLWGTGVGTGNSVRVSRTLIV
jgi:hypothetical protein